jgi:hypothetical protein
MAPNVQCKMYTASQMYTITKHLVVLVDGPQQFLQDYQRQAFTATKSYLHLLDIIIIYCAHRSRGNLSIRRQVYTTVSIPQRPSSRV